MTNALYNEIEPYAAEWLDNLVAAGRIAPGRVDRRSIVDLEPADVAGPGQRHFFAGIGGWSYALRLAGVPDDADVWTGSCPCQPLSDAGKRLGTRDARHLWPAWFELIRQCRPATIFGEQVASRLGLAWLDIVRADLERCGYAFGASDLCAASVGAPHIRQRHFFVAFAGDERREGERLRIQPGRPRQAGVEVGGGSAPRADQLGNSSGSRSWRDLRGLPDAQAQGEAEGREHGRECHEPVDAGAARAVGNAAIDVESRTAGCRQVDRTQAEGTSWFDGNHRAEHAGANGRGMVDAEESRQRTGRTQGRQRGRALEPDRSGAVGEGVADAAAMRRARTEAGQERGRIGQPRASRAIDPWRDCEWLPCTDGVSRPVEPGLEPLAHGVSGRVAVRRADESAEAEVQEHWYNRCGALAGFGNAIVPQVAAVFIEAAIAARGGLK